MRICIVKGCGRSAAQSRSPLCSVHKTNARRHGHPLQKGITKGQVKPFREAVQGWIITQENSETLKTRINERWSIAIQEMEDVEKLSKAGHAMNKYDRIAALELLKVSRNVDPQEVAETMIGLALMYQQAPRTFVSDDGYWFQMARRYRGLTDLNAGSWYDHAEGRVKKVYKDLPPKAAKRLGRILAEVFGPVAALINNKMEQEAQHKADTKRALFEAVDAI